MLTNIMSQGAFSLLAPFYPDIAEKEKGLSSFLIGMIMSSFSVSFVIVSYIIGIKISKIGRRFTLYSGIILQSISMIGFGCIIWVNDKIIFIVLSLGFRLLGGAACSFICVAAYAMTAIQYRENVQAKISLLEAANGAGLFVGPIFGGLIYEFTHFCVPFFLFTAIFLSFIPLMKRALTSKLDADDHLQVNAKRIGYFRLLKNKRILFAALTQFINIICFSYGSPIFGPRLKDDYNFSNAIIGVCFALPTVSYILTGPILMPILTKKFECRANIIIGFLILMIGGIFIGPSKTFGLPSVSAPMMITGLCILGSGAAFTVIPVIPEMLNAIDGQYPDHKAEISDNFSGIFNVAGGFGQIIGPTIAGLLKGEVGFNYTFDILNLCVLLFTLTYIFVCDGIGSLGRSFKATALRCKRNKNRQTSSPISHHLLVDEKDALDEVKLESDSVKILNKNDDESANEINDSTYNILYSLLNNKNKVLNLSLVLI